MIFIQTVSAQTLIEPSSRDNISFNCNSSNHLRQTDSFMMSVFGKEGFQRYFKVDCFKNKDNKTDTGKYLQPCDTNQLSHCREALITYSYINQKVPLKIELNSYISEKYNYCNPSIVWPYLLTQIPLNHLQLLSPEEINKKFKKKFKKKSIVIILKNIIIRYSKNPSEDPTFINNKFDSSRGKYPHREIIVHKAAKNWNGGFYYLAYDNKYSLDHDDEKLHHQKAYFIDATTGSILYEIILVDIKDEKLKHYKPRKD